MSPIKGRNYFLFKNKLTMWLFLELPYKYEWGACNGTFRPIVILKSKFANI